MNMYGGGDEYDSDYESEVSVSSIGGEAVSDFEYEDDDNNGHMDCTVPTDLPPLPDNLSALFVLPSCPEHLSQLPPFLSIAERDNDIDMDPVHAENDDSNGVQTEEQIQQRDNEIISSMPQIDVNMTDLTNANLVNVLGPLPEQDLIFYDKDKYHTMSAKPKQTGNLTQSTNTQSPKKQKMDLDHFVVDESRIVNKGQRRRRVIKGMPIRRGRDIFIVNKAHDTIAKE
eukprot:951676_1